MPQKVPEGGSVCGYVRLRRVRGPVVECSVPFRVFCHNRPMARRRIRIRRKERGAVSPAVAFSVLVLVLAGILAGFALLERDDTEGQPAVTPQGTPTEEDLSLTDDEAIARLDEIETLRIQALEKRDPDLLDGAFTSNGPAIGRLTKSIRMLIADGVRLRQRAYDVAESEVILNSQSTIRIRRTVRVNIQFTDESGRRVTEGTGAERQVLVAVLKRVAGEWLFHDGRIVEATPLS